jgi:hypothetical protein
MRQQTSKRHWIKGDQYIKEKHAGVRDVLIRAAYDAPYRKRLLCKDDPTTVQTAFNEAGNFEQLPADFRIECFEREGADEGVTDNTVMLVLPEAYQLAQGGKPTKYPVTKYWNCTYRPYLPTKPKKGVKAVKTKSSRKR